MEALKNYAETELNLEKMQIVNQDYLKDNKALFYELVDALFTKWQDLQAENERLKTELEQVSTQERHKEAVAKAHLVKLLNYARG